eukprot:jgi/Bigna1/81968/fgenesh1_pg.86_\
MQTVFSRAPNQPQGLIFHIDNGIQKINITAILAEDEEGGNTDHDDAGESGVNLYKPHSFGFAWSESRRFRQKARILCALVLTPQIMPMAHRLGPGFVRSEFICTLGCAWRGCNPSMHSAAFYGNPVARTKSMDLSRDAIPVTKPLFSGSYGYQTRLKHMETYMRRKGLVRVHAMQDEILKSVKDNQVMIYSKSYCPFCVKVKDLFQNQLGITPTVIELDEQPNEEMESTLKGMTNQRTVPQAAGNGKLQEFLAKA